MAEAERAGSARVHGRERRELEELARLYGVQPVHEDGFQREVRPEPEVLLTILRSLGAPLSALTDVPRALRNRRLERARAIVEPVAVLWGEGARSIPLGEGVGEGDDVEARLRLEGGEVVEWRASAHPAPPAAPAPEWPSLAGPPAASHHLSIPRTLPFGYHELEVEVGGRWESGLILVAPHRAFGAPVPREGEPPARMRGWGAFLPLYALRHEGDQGVGDLSGLEAMLHWVGGSGGQIVGTLPLFAAFLDEPLEPSPYSPVSRLFWNELYIDPKSLPEWELAPEARELVASPAFRSEVDRLRSLPEVEYRAVAGLRNRVLDVLARRWEERGGRKEGAFETFAASRPELHRYADFRAAAEEIGPPGDGWSEGWREEGVPDTIGDAGTRLRHLYAQFRFGEQLRRVRRSGAASGAGLYLDLPLGTHPDGFDVWASPGLFAEGARIGAPPDGFNPEGQDWGLPPLRPDGSRREGHRHFRRVIGTLLGHSDHLRIDHVMSLHRLYWVPQGGSAVGGAYVRYPAEELYAILSLESHRHQAVLAGEDLGTVPPEVRSAMERVGLRRSYVVPFEIRPEAPGGMSEVPEGAVASLNTHDLPPFASFWSGADLRERRARGDLDGEGFESEMRWREQCRTVLSSLSGVEKEWEPGAGAVLAGLLRWLGRSPAGLVLVNLEDLWQEERPQNRPGTMDPRSWRGRARMSLEDFARDGEAADLLEILQNARAGAL